MARPRRARVAAAQLESVVNLSGYGPSGLYPQSLSMSVVYRWLGPATVTSLLVAFVAWPQPVYSQTEVTDSRFWHGPERTRLVLELSGAAAYRVFSLGDPRRIVIDIDEGRLRQGVNFTTTAGGSVAGGRTGRPDPETFRIVLDLRHAATFRAFLLDPSDG